METIATRCLLLAAFFGGSGVIAGAFGAHGLKERVTPDLLAVFEVGVRYQMYHALALLALGAVAGSRVTPNAAGWASITWTLGVLIFSGSLYVLTLTGLRWLGAITPIGGVLMIVGWGFLAYGAWRASRG